MDKTKFWDKVAAKYAKSPIKDMAAYEYTLGRTKSYLKKTDHVLELGCGTGSTALLLAENVKHIAATDISGKMIKIAQEKAHTQNIPNVNFRQMELCDLQQVDGGYDVILALNLLHLLETPQEAIKFLGGHLKKGGLFISKTPCLSSKAWLFTPMIKAMQFFGKAPYVGMLSVSGLDKMVMDAGFEILEKGDYPNAPPSHYIVARKL